MISYTDLLMLSVALAAVFIDKTNKIMWLLFSEFAFFIGMGAYIENDTLLTDSVMMLCNVIYCALFLLVRAPRLSVISGMIALYYAFVVIVLKSNVSGVGHYETMFVFCILQLCVIAPGALNGINKYRGRTSTNNNRDNNHYKYNH